MPHDAPPTPQPRLPSPVVQTTAWCVAAVVTILVLALRSLPVEAPAVGWPSLVGLTLLALAAARQDVWARVRTEHREVQEMVDLDEVALVLVLFLLEPVWAVAVAVPTYTVALAVENRPAIKTIFNIASRTTTVGIAAMLASLVVTAPVERLDVVTTTTVTGAVLVHVVLNFLSVKVVVAAATGDTLRRTIRTTADLNVVMWIGNATLGLAATALWLQHPLLVLVAAALANVVRRAYHTVVVVNELADELGVERDRLRQLLDGARDGILQLDADGCVTTWNPALERLTGLPASVALGTGIDDLVADRVVVEHGPVSLAAPVLGAARPDDNLLSVTAAGEERSIVARHSLQYDRDGEVVGDIVQLHDRTAAVRAARAEHDILARVSHELLTPLTVIRGFTQTIAHHGDEIGTSMRHDLLRRLGRSTMRMEGLVHDLLAVSGATPTAELEQRDLLPLVTTAVGLEAADWLGHDVQVRGRPVDAVVCVASFTTVVRHLVRNACNYSPADAPVTVSLDLDRRGENAVVRVQDRGRGIPASRLEEMFGPFTRVEDPLHMETRGAGLGLHVVQQLVAALGGTIEARSTVGEGSTFEVRMPAVLAVRERSASSGSV